MLNAYMLIVGDYIC